MGFELTRLATATDERAATVGAGRTVGGSGLPVGDLTLKRQIVEQAGAHAIVAFVHGDLNFAQGGIGMLQVPLAHASHNIGESIFHGVGCLAAHLILLLCIAWKDATPDSPDSQGSNAKL